MYNENEIFFHTLQIDWIDKKITESIIIDLQNLCSNEWQYFGISMKRNKMLKCVSRVFWS